MALERQQGDALPEARDMAAQQFNDYKPIIETLYSHQGWTLEQVCLHMKRVHGFQATPRRYKARFRTWEFPLKKITKDDYKAMYVIGTFCHNNHQAVHFFALKAFNYKIKTLAQITKEVYRGKCVAPVVNPSASREAYLLEALEKVRSSKTRIFKGQQEVVANIHAILELCRQSRIESPAASARNHDRSIVTATGGSITTPAGWNSTCGIRAQFYPVHGAQNIQEAQYSFHEGHTSLQGISPKQSSRYDFEEALDVALIPSSPSHANAPPYHLDLVQQPHTIPTLIIPDSQKAAVNRWYRPYYYHCFRKTDHRHRAVEFDHSLAMSELQKLLNMDSGNEYFLVLLNWMFCILYFNCKNSELEVFLHESLTVVQTTLGHDSPLCIALQYMVSWVQKDVPGQQHWGSLLSKAQEEIGACYGPGHPSLIVYQYYWAYHCWQQDDTQQALEVLSTCLTAANDLMGPNYLLTIQCLATQARVFAKTGQHGHAVTAARDALRRFCYGSELLLPYKLDIMRILASSLSLTGNSEQAERLLQEVVASRVALLGLLVFDTHDTDMTYTWHAIFELMRVMETQGCPKEAEGIYEKYKKQYYQELAEQEGR